MSSIHNTQCCLLKAPGVTYERLLPICLTLFSCGSCHAVCMSAAAADRSLSCPPLQPTPSSSHPTIISGSLRNSLAMWGYAGTKKAVTLWPPEPAFLTWTSYFLPRQQKTKTNLIMHLCSSEKKRKPLHQCSALTIIYPHDLWFLRQGLLDTYNREVTARRLSISRLACPYLFSSPSLSSLHLVCTT